MSKSAFWVVNHSTNRMHAHTLAGGLSLLHLRGIHRGSTADLCETTAKGHGEHVHLPQIDSAMAHRINYALESVKRHCQEWVALYNA